MGPEIVGRLFGKFGCRELYEKSRIQFGGIDDWMSLQPVLDDSWWCSQVLRSVEIVVQGDTAR